VNTVSDARHCGACDRACPVVPNATPSCVQSQCSYTCNAGFSRCGNACVDTSSDEKNCGQCSKHCGNKKTCINGVCQK
jgi:hypothetical protein